MAIFATGATEAESPVAEKALLRNFTAEELKAIRPFCMHSGLNYERMSRAGRSFMTLFRLMVKGMKNGDPALLAMLFGSYDHCAYGAASH